MNPFKKVKQLEEDLEACRSVANNLYRRLNALEDYLDVKRIYRSDMTYGKVKRKGSK